MAGGRDRLKREAELSMRVAHLGEQFARVKRLEPAEHYLAKGKPGRRQTGEQMLAALRSYQSAGAAMTIVERPA